MIIIDIAAEVGRFPVNRISVISFLRFKYIVFPIIKITVAPVISVSIRKVGTHLKIIQRIEIIFKIQIGAMIIIDVIGKAVFIIDK